ARVVLGVSLFAGPAHATDYTWFFGAGAEPRVYKGNDTGGIIPWSCEAEADAQVIAADFCARWDKYHRITSVHRQYGDYIAFVCLWSPYVNPYAIPAARTRTSCLRNGPVVKALD